MEINDNAVVKAEAMTKSEEKTTADTYKYDPDEYLKELYGDMSYYDENCFSCGRWLGYGCRSGSCDYESS